MSNERKITVQERHNRNERITERSICCFKYDLRDHDTVVGEFGTYEMFYDHSIAMMHLGELEDILFDKDGKRIDVVPKEFHQKCLQLEIKKRIELERKLNELQKTNVVTNIVQNGEHVYNIGHVDVLEL